MIDKLIPKNIGEWDSLAYWRSGEWQATKEKLDETQYNPGPSLLFAGLRLVGPGPCACAIMGQDPYPRREHCAGVAFGCPSSVKVLPPTLINIFKEYEGDLHYPQPMHGDLTRWCEQGVLLWNVYPSCAPGKPGSHHWEEWTYLTKEIIEILDAKEIPIVFVFLGSVAASFSKYVIRSKSIVTSHPSPLGSRHGFAGSRIFTTINTSLRGLGRPAIDWRLP